MVSICGRSITLKNVLGVINELTNLVIAPVQGLQSNQIFIFSIKLSQSLARYEKALGMLINVDLY